MLLNPNQRENALNRVKGPATVLVTGATGGIGAALACPPPVSSEPRAPPWRAIMTRIPPMHPCRARTPTLLLALLTGSAGHAAPPVSQVAGNVTANAPPAAPAPAVSSEVGSYDIGLLFGNQLQHNGVVPNLSQEALIRGLKEAVGGRPVTNEEREAALNFMRHAHDVLADKNRAEGREFLARNAKQPGVKTMPSGLQYRVLAAGDPRGNSPTPTDTVTVRYRASLADGTEFDRSEAHDRPASFRVNSVFKGWQEAFLAMKPGAKWQLFVPPELGYGANPPPLIPPGAVLVYELELLQVEPAAPMDPAAAQRLPNSHAKPAAASPEPQR
jgi:FKBP-type peptidyl-prolyl cis-trans isomerase FklB